jgi:hypothetical protein
MKPIACPFCGVLTEVPHDTQEGCIHALHAEIAHVREVLEAVRQPSPDADGAQPATAANHCRTSPV